MTEAQVTETAGEDQPGRPADDRPVDLYEIQGFLDAQTVAGLVAELERMSGAPATVLSEQPGGVVVPNVRKVTRLEVSPATGERIKRLLLDRIAELEAHFGIAVSELEAPQFLRYEPGDFFVAHQDGNTPLIYDESRFRRISGVVFLSQQSEEPVPNTYGGGQLLFHGPYDGPRVRLVPTNINPGTLVTFRAETTHEVTMVTHGVRYSVAAFLR